MMFYESLRKHPVRGQWELAVWVEDDPAAEWMYRDLGTNRNDIAQRRVAGARAILLAQAATRIEGLATELNNVAQKLRDAARGSK
jgi:hypothetical protein